MDAWFCITLSIFSYFSTVRTETNFAERPKIAIIGAGIGGTSTAYFLSEIKGLEPEIDVYSKDPVGGRLATITIAGHEYETGGSILHPRNKYMRLFSEKFDLPPKKGISGKFGIYDGTQFLYKQGDWSAINLISLLWRYGMSIIKINSIVDTMLGKFERIYKLQEEGNIFTNINELLWAMDPSFLDMLERSLEAGLKEEGIADIFIQELAVAVMRVNYGQSVDAHQFVGSVSLAGAESSLWSVHGGNKKIPMALLNDSGARLIPQEVETVTLMADNKLALQMKDSEEPPVIYDAVILATPLTRDTSSLHFVNFPTRFRFPGTFHRTVCTMVHGDVNYETFGFSDESSVLDEIFTSNTSLFFNSLSRNYPVDIDDGVEGLPNVWKVFSNEPLTRDQLSTLFRRTREVHVVDWKAYPEYDGTAAVAGNFTLYPGLYHINTVEWAASAMEMSVIGGRNVALLAASHFGIDVRDANLDRNAHNEL